MPSPSSRVHLPEISCVRIIRCHTKVVLFWGEGVSMLALCLLNLGLKFFANLTYVWTFLPPSEVTVAW